MTILVKRAEIVAYWQLSDLAFSAVKKSLYVLTSFIKHKDDRTGGVYFLTQVASGLSYLLQVVNHNRQC